MVTETVGHRGSSWSTGSLPSGRPGGIVPTNPGHQPVKVIIQIPCLNEAGTLPETLTDLPRELPGVDVVEWLLIDDGSTDDTALIARQLGVDHLVRMNGNQGLARAFTAGLLAAVELGADVVVNTDADNQYRSEDIGALLAPILAGEADMVIGSRPIDAIRHFSLLKRFLQRLGSRVVRTASGTAVRDAPSGFRAFTADAALRLNVFSGYTYTLETIIQAGSANLRIADVPIRVNAPTRPSRLIRSLPSYVWRSVGDILRTYVIYHPAQIFGLMGALFVTPAAGLAVRYLVYAARGEGTGHVQSVIASGVLAICGVFMLAIGVVAHLQGVNRRLLEESRYLLHFQRLGPTAAQTAATEDTGRTDTDRCAADRTARVDDLHRAGSG